MLKSAASKSETIQPRFEGIGYEDLTPGRFEDAFRGNAGVVVVRGDPRIRRLWKGLMEDRTCWPDFPWEKSLVEMARNHQHGNMNVGDMVRFVPGGFSHVARKILFARVDGQLRTYPALDADGVGVSIMDQEMLELAWDIMADLLSASLPAKAEKPRYVVGLDLIKYPDSVEDLNAMQHLMGDSSAGWSLFGQRLDAYKNLATEGLNVPLLRLRDWFAFGSMIPGVRQILGGINRWVDRATHHEVRSGHAMIGGPHVDGAKVITALMGDRDVISTEARIGKRWVEFPVNTDSISVFPAKHLQKYVGYAGTMHRILMRTDQPSGGDSPNVSLALSVIDGKDADRLFSLK